MEQVKPKIESIMQNFKCNFEKWGKGEKLKSALTLYPSILVKVYMKFKSSDMATKEREERKLI